MDALERQAAIKAELDKLFSWSWVAGLTSTRSDNWHECRVYAAEMTEEKQQELSAVLDWQGGIMSRAWPNSIAVNSPFIIDFIARLKDVGV